MSYFPGQPYNACLSITILPAVFENLLNLPAEYVFKFLFQLFFCCTPAIVYFICANFLPRALAFLGASLFFGQTWFYEQMPALARQETAMIFFSLLILALVDRTLPVRSRRVLSQFFVLIMVLAHYSTAYVWVVVGALAYLGSVAVRLMFRRHRFGPRILGLPLVLVGFLSLYAWEGPATHTLSHATSTASAGSNTLADLLDPKVLAQGVHQAFLAPTNDNTVANLNAAYQAAILNRPGSAAAYFPTSTYAGYKPRPLSDSQSSRDLLPSFVSKPITLLSTVVKAVVENVFSFLGIVLLMAQALRRRRWRRVEMALLGASSFGLILLVLFLPFLQENYNITRLFLQLLVVLAVPTVIGFWRVIPVRGRSRVAVIGVTVAFIFASRCGLIDQVTGGQLRITMTQPKGTFDTFYVHQDEVYAAQWLSSNREPNVPVYADSVAALRLESFGHLDSEDQIFPATIPVSSYVYLIEANTGRKHAFVQFGNVTYSYAYPLSFLQRTKDLVFSDGTSEVFR
ncbi:hypothetical protein acdb102_19490 [Acidothermaceae bacterium B102]|nr:hypothetical protein acdb102_19490 [Acidothermaceae bacterium B102]